MIECVNHPGVKHQARGLCKNCYDGWLKAENPAYAERQRQNVEDWYGRNPDYKYPKDKRRVQSLQRTANRRSALQATLEKQGNKCGLCGITDAKRWHRDHDHRTGVWRAILCSKCNNGLGFLNDDPVMFRKAAAYVESYQIDRVVGPEETNRKRHNPQRSDR